MKVRLYGFSLEAGNAKVSLGDLLNRMSALSGDSDNSRASERRIYFSLDADPTYARGLVVTVKDQKRFLKLIRDRGRLVINVENLQGEDKLMEVNFFVINKSNGIGLYQHYFQSCSMNVFGSYLIDRYRDASHVSSENEIQELVDSGRHTNKKEREIKRAHRGRLSFATLVHSGNLSTVLRQFERIQSFEYEFAELDAIRRVAQPLSPYVKRRKEKVTFEPRFAVGTIATAVHNAVAAIQPRSGRVHVVTDDGDPISVRLEDIPENFGEYDYDEVAARLNNLDTAEFADHETFRDLQRICNSEAYSHIFNAQIEQ